MKRMRLRSRRTTEGGRRRKKVARQAWRWAWAAGSEGCCAGKQTDAGTRKRIREIDK
jgi:hypothetical protein